MKRLFLAAGLCVAAIVAAPVAAANAETLKGTCAVSGTATFSNPALLSASPVTGQGYAFSGTANCKELPGGEAAKANVKVAGTGTLSCEASAARSQKAQTASSKSRAGKTQERHLNSSSDSRHSRPGSIALVVEPSGAGHPTATGEANFYKAKNATSCANGVGELALEAETVGEL
jgi:hypothetical protein